MEVRVRKLQLSGGRKLDGPQVVVLAEFGAIPFKLFLSLTGVIRRPGEFLGRGAQTKKSRSRIIPNSGAGRTRRSDAQMLMTMYLLVYTLFFFKRLWTTVQS